MSYRYQIMLLSRYRAEQFQTYGEFNSREEAEAHILSTYTLDEIVSEQITAEPVLTDAQRKARYEATLLSQATLH